jgi:dipeptidyl aminopeptidase/acylaminoacyl peptidase
MNSRQLPVLGLVLVLPLVAKAAPELAPLESYGNLPAISSMALSPSGHRVAFRHVQDDKDFVFVRELDTGDLVGGADVSEVKPRDLYFLDDDTVLLVVSDTMRERFGRKAFENSAAFVLDVATHKLHQLLRHAEELYPAQTGLGRVVGRSADGRVLYMPAFTGTTAASYSLFRVALDHHSERSVVTGRPDTIDWFVDAGGRPVVEEEFDNRNNVHRIWVHRDGKRELIYEKQTSIPVISVVGLTSNRDALVLDSVEGEADRSWHYHMSLEDGAVTGPFYARDDADVERTLLDLNRLVYGVEYSGFLPTYEFADPELTTRVKAVQDALQGTAVTLIDWTPSFDRLLFRISGGWSSGDFVLAGKGLPKPVIVAHGRPDISSEQVVPTAIVKYAARDGVTIPALLTVDRDAIGSGDKLPLIVMPHGGPASYDRFGFDWMAQYFASRGYAVLQPQFRGSSGFGVHFQELGQGEWGAGMSTDLDDGVDWLIHQGLVDPDRVAIVGASYGGYAALAAGAFSPLDYKCIVSIAGVSDLPRMLKAARERFGRDHWAVQYWQDQFGSEEKEKEKLNAISPLYGAEAFRAPVLLVHGRDDTVVEIDQSERMYRALKKADKDVTFVQLDGEDHWLSSAETRLEALRAVADFIREKL